MNLYWRKRNAISVTSDTRGCPIVTNITTNREDETPLLKLWTDRVYYLLKQTNKDGWCRQMKFGLDKLHGRLRLHPGLRCTVLIGIKYLCWSTHLRIYFTKCKLQMSYKGEQYSVTLWIHRYIIYSHTCIHTCSVIFMSVYRFTCVGQNNFFVLIDCFVYHVRDLYLHHYLASTWSPQTVLIMVMTTIHFSGGHWNWL